MSGRRLPVRPNPSQLKNQAKDLLRQIRSGDPAAIEEFKKCHVKNAALESAQLSDAQLVLARSYDAPGTPLAGTTLLHMCVDYDEAEIARWLLDHGMNVDAKAAVDANGFGGHTALFATVVSQPNFWMNHRGEAPSAPLTQMLLDHGADPNVRASLRKQLHPGYGEEAMHEYLDVTPLGWGERFHRGIFVNTAATELIAKRGGHT